MPRPSVVLALQDPALNQRYADALAKVPDLQVVFRTRDLVSTYGYVEEHGPDAVVISSGLAAKPEFDVMRALFATFDVRWLVVRDGTARAAGPTPRADLFEIDATTPVAQVAATILQVTRSRRRAAVPGSGLVERSTS